MKAKPAFHWVLVALLCGMAASAIGVCTNCVGIFYTPVSDSLGVLRGSFALHATISQLATSCIALAVPKLMGRFRYKRLLLCGVTVAVLSTAAMAFSRELWLFYLTGLLRGLGVGLFSTVPITIILTNWFHKSHLTNWFHKSHGVATSITLSFSGLAGAVCSPLFTRCVTVLGWENAYLVMAAAILLFTLPALLVPFTADPRQMGMRPYGDYGEQKDDCRPAATFRYKNAAFLCLCVMTLLHTSIAGIAQHFTGFALSIRLTAETGALMMSLSMVGNILTKLLIGILSDRIGPVKACISMILLNACALLLSLYGSASQSALVLYAAALLYGSVYSVGAVGFSLLCRRFFGLENYSKAYSVIGLLTTTGSAISLPLIGYLYDFTGSYLPMFWIALGFHGVNLALLWAISRLVKVKRNEHINEK